jgi:hypothetical protein
MESNILGVKSEKGNKKVPLRPKTSCRKHRVDEEFLWHIR